MLWIVAAAVFVTAILAWRVWRLRTFQPPKETISERTRTEWMRDRRI